MSSKLYLIPSLLGESDFHRVLPKYNIEIVEQLQIFVVENEKSARRFIKTILPNKKQSELEIHILNKNTTAEELYELAQLFDRKESIGIISEAGLPAIADPGANLVTLAHKRNVQVNICIVPLQYLLVMTSEDL